MKVTALLLLVVAGLVWAKPSHSSLDATDLADIAQVEAEVARIKRSGIGSGSGSFDLLSGLKKTLLSGIGSASASLVAGSSSSSLSSGSGHASGGSSGDGGHSYGHSSSSHSYEKPHDEGSHFDGWSLKKSILNTLFQAVKAITGGVTAIKGQLIKGSGYLVSGAGKLIATGGDAVTGVGKKIALSAHLIPPKHAASPFAKLSGLLSSSSGALSSSSSPSSSHNQEHHESSAESYTDYAGPTSYAGTHDSSHGSFSSSGPSGPAFHSPPPHKSSHKTPSINSYGVDLDDHHQQQQQHHGGGSYVSGGTGGKYSHSSSDVAHHYPVHVGGKGHPANVVEASDVLRQILNQKVAPEHAPKKVIAQYEIPSDSHPPPFKPMKHGYLPPHPPHPPPSGYGLPVGLIDSVTHSHSITTSFGHAASPFPSSYDIYRSMSLKHGHQGPDTDSFPSPRSKPHGGPTSVAYELLPPKPGATGEDEFVHNQQLHDLAKHLGNGIEVQRSLTYEIADPALSKHKRRSDETSDTNDDDDNNDAAPAVAAAAGGGGGSVAAGSTET